MLNVIQQEVFQSLRPLPGGNSQYLGAINEMLSWIEERTYLDRIEFTERIISRYSAGRSSVSGYIQTLARLGFIHTNRSKNIELTDEGKVFIESSSEDQATRLASYLLQNFTAFEGVLEIYAKAEKPIHLNEVIEKLQPQFPNWATESSFEDRVLWLYSLKCIRPKQKRYYEITPFGKAIFLAHTSHFTDHASFTAIPESLEKADYLLSLSQELHLAARDSKSHSRFEFAVEAAFQSMGFETQHIGKNGDTDILLYANIGKDAYKVIVDTKSRHDGHLSDLSVHTLLDHATKHDANYTIVVAEDFAIGKVARHAIENNIVLLRVSLLDALIKQHTITPLNLEDYRAVFSFPGIIEDIPQSLRIGYQQKQKWGELLVDLSKLIRASYENGLNIPLPGNQLFPMLATWLGSPRYSQQELVDAIQLLTHPAIRCASGNNGEGIFLLGPQSSIANSLRKLADLVEKQ